MAFGVNFSVSLKTILPEWELLNCFSIDNATSPEIPLGRSYCHGEHFNDNKAEGATALRSTSDRYFAQICHASFKVTVKNL